MTSINRTSEQRAQFTNASFPRRMGAAFYDGLLLLGLWMISTLVVIALNNRDAPLQGLIYQLFLYLESLLFFVYFWTFKGQTLGMQVWRIQLISESGQLLNPRAALFRYLVTTLSVGCFGLGYLWMLAPHRRALRASCSARGRAGIGGDSGAFRARAGVTAPATFVLVTPLAARDRRATGLHRRYATSAPATPIARTGSSGR